MAPVPLLLSPRSRTPPTDYVVVEYLVVAGGGDGGARTTDINDPDAVRTNGGGGGAGGVLSGIFAMRRGVDVQVSVGAADGGSNGGNSVLGDDEAIGGGAGGTGGASPENGYPGGSGGGGAQTQSGTTSGGAGTAGQGSAGAGGNSGGAGSGGGGGIVSSITGESVTYAVGGSSTDGSTPPPNTGWGGSGSIGLQAGIVVSGAGDAAANGTYTVSGTSFLDSPEYRLGSTDFYIRNDGANWIIVQDDGQNPPSTRYTLNATPADPEFYEPYTGPDPEGPAAVFLGAEPAPSIEAGASSSEARAGASGVVVVAYPSTLPALTVSGLTYNQPTREGYRVYRFTAGTGTIRLG